MENKKGALYIAAASAVFGFLPVISKTGQNIGINTVTLTFLRMVLALPVMLFVLIGRGESLRLEKKELKSVALLGFFGMGGTMLTLNYSYIHMNVGAATAVHFCYPALILLWNMMRGGRWDAKDWLSVTAVGCGIAMLAGSGGGSAAGAAAAAVSGVCYAFYIVYSARTAGEMDSFKLSFYVCLFAGIGIFLMGGMLGGIDLSFARRGWAYAIAVSALSSICAVPLFQAGVERTGEVRAGVLSAVEPAAGLVFGHIFMGEHVGGAELTGCAVMLAGVFSAKKRNSTAKSSTVSFEGN